MSREISEPIILSRDGSLWAVHKPAGMLVHATAGDTSDLMHWLESHHESARGIAPCHRLDVGTSGVVLCSTDASVRGEIGAAFAAGTVKKQYLALVYGATHKRGVIKRPLKSARSKGMVEARTRYLRLELFGGFSLVQLNPETGRKHQIRRHLKGIGHPIVGDTRYGPRRFRRVPGFPGRLWLHAKRLTLPDNRAFHDPLPAALEAHLTFFRDQSDEP